ncbi:MAG: sigma-70 family RNA polymerase sigma factor [Isosphaeraceae bacterium]
MRGKVATAGASLLGAPRYGRRGRWTTWPSRNWWRAWLAGTRPQPASSSVGSRTTSGGSSALARLPRALRAQFDSLDFVQAVWQSFFNEAGEPRRFDGTEHLRAYLAGIARNKVLEEYRRRTTSQKYDIAKEEPLYVTRGGREQPRELRSNDPSPSQHVQARDRFSRFTSGRSPVEVEVIRLREQGLTFEEIAVRTGLGERSVRRVIEAIRPLGEDPE